jgi:hypothetical protein
LDVTEEVREYWRQLHIEELYELYTSQQYDYCETISENKLVGACRLYERQENLSKLYSEKREAMRPHVIS